MFDKIGLLLPVISAEACLEILGFGLGVLIGRASKDIDHEIQETSWFKGLTSFQQWALKAVMDILHHWQYGMILIVLAWTYLEGTNAFLFVYALGVGLILDDLPDIPARYKGLFHSWTEEPPSTP